MIYIRHRVNSVDELQTVDPAHGIEIDLRSDVGRAGAIHLAHDPWVLGQDFDSWLDAFVARKIGGPLILNTKEDALEERATEVLQKRGVQSYFFLDTALPTLVRWSAAGKGKPFAVRISACEPVEAIAAFRGKVGWAWVDCFGGKPLAATEVARLKSDFRICLVSPELQKQPLETIANFRELHALADAVCTKSPKTWTDLYGF